MPKIDINWVAVGAGRLALWHRPAFRIVPHLRAAGCDRVVTLLAAREGADEIGAAVQTAGLAWSWIPLDGGVPPEGRRSAAVVEALRDVSAALDRGESVLIHCSAGIHRTGMIAYALLRLRGVPVAPALERLNELRAVTRAGVAFAHLAWGDTVAEEAGNGASAPAGIEFA